VEKNSILYKKKEQDRREIKVQRGNWAMAQKEMEWSQAKIGTEMATCISTFSWLCTPVIKEEEQLHHVATTIM